MDDSTKHPLVGKYVMCTFNRQLRGRSGLMGRYGGVVRSVRTYADGSLRSVRMQRPSTMDRSSNSANCHGETVTLDPDELARTDVIVRGKGVPMATFLAKGGDE